MGRRGMPGAADAGRRLFAAPACARRRPGSRRRAGRCARTGFCPRARSQRRRRPRRRPVVAAAATREALRLSGTWLEWPDGPGRPARRRPRGRARRARRADGPQRRRASRRCCAWPPACSSPRRGRVRAAGRVALLLQNPGDYLVHERVGDEARPPRWRGRARRPWPSATRATSPAASASASRWRSSWATGEPAGGGVPRRADARHGPRAQGRARRRICASWRRAGAAVIVATHDCRVRRRVRAARRPARRRRGRRRRPDRRDARRRLVLRHRDRAHPRRRRRRAAPEEGAELLRAPHDRGGGSRELAARLLLGARRSRWRPAFAWYERTHPSARVLALVATLAALAALGRIAFAPLPNVKPTTDIVLIAGARPGRRARLRRRRGGRAGAPTCSSARARGRRGRWPPGAWCGLAGAVLGRLTPRAPGRLTAGGRVRRGGPGVRRDHELLTWVTFTGDHTLGAYLGDRGHGAARSTSPTPSATSPSPWPSGRRCCARSRASAGASRSPGARAPAAAAPLVALALALRARAAPARRRHARAPTWSTHRTPTAAGARPPAPAPRSSTRAGRRSGWRPRAATRPTCAAAGIRRSTTSARPCRRPHRHRRARAHDPRARARRGRARAASAAATSSPALERHRRGDGSLAGQRRATRRSAFSRCGPRGGRGRPAPGARGAWVARQQNADGGFNGSARAAARARSTTPARRSRRWPPAAARLARGDAAAVSFLRRHQNPDGGFAARAGRVLQRAVHRLRGPGASSRPGTTRPACAAAGSRSRSAYLRSLTQGSGAVRYSRTSAQTPVWVTAQAVMALARKALPAAAASPAGRARRRPPAAAPAPPRSAKTGASGGAAPPRASAALAPRTPMLRVGPRPGHGHGRRDGPHSPRTWSSAEDALGFPPRYASRCPQGDRGARAPRRARPRGRRAS